MMGRNWKKKDRLAPDVSIYVPVDYKWSSQSYTLKEILNNFKLPVVVQCREETAAEHVKNFFFELRQPVLLHTQCTSRKVFARCVRKAAGGTIKELLPEVVIPADYSGWFKISKGLEFAKPTPHRTIESLTSTSSEFFLCTTDFDALLLPDITDDADEEELDDEAFRRRVQEGEVLRKTGVQKLNQMLLPATFQRSAPDNRYLMCIDMQDRELFIPILQKGLFYEVSDGTFDNNDNGVVQVSDLLDEMVIFPIYVRHILGDPPPISKFYSPCLKLDRFKNEETVMGSTLESEEDDFLPIEIQIESPIKFEIALNTPMLQTNVDYREAVQLCNNINQNYMTDMKLAVTFKRIDEDPGDGVSSETQVYSNPAFVGDENETGSVCNSQRTSIMSTVNGSEIGEVDANSEFNIQWDPASGSPKVSRRQTSNLSNATDCASIDSLGDENAKKFNLVLGGKYVDTLDKIDTGVTPTLSGQYRQDRDVDGTLRAERDGDVILKSNDGVEITPFVDIVEGITDFSVRPGFQQSVSETRVNMPVYKTGYPCITVPPIQLQQRPSSVYSSQTISSSASQSSSSASLASSERNEVNLSDHFPSMNSSSNESLSSAKQRIKRRSPKRGTRTSGQASPIDSDNDFTFTGDVFINHTAENDGGHSVCQPSANTELIDKEWGDPYRVIRSKDMNKSREVYQNPERAQITGKYRHSSLTEELMMFTQDDTAVPHPEGIVTCTVADEMMSSYNDLRISLEEVTKSAHEEHSENTWKAFCLERSSSLPVRSNSSAKKPAVHAEDYSQSWEQISPRRTDDSTTTSASSKRKDNTPRSLSKAKPKQEQRPDRALLLDTSSDESSQFSYRTGASFGSADNSFTISDVSDNDVSNSGLPVLREYDLDNGTIRVDGTVQNGNTLTRDKHVLSKRMKVRREIKRKKKAEWCEQVSEI